ncbi:hypothetical protein C487_02718 [Natrinema pallidum DSM 3751]|uniref:Uncharacterized protein n=1 Tax=Natrinema pallidum DSM 3751 TaxID=1227495 RepID=L9Z956_9EURY|nr:hypothetical protein C487_02718 [Natrinema pallidum DSM 3751]
MSEPAGVEDRFAVAGGSRAEKRVRRDSLRERIGDVLCRRNVPFLTSETDVSTASRTIDSRSAYCLESA